MIKLFLNNINTTRLIDVISKPGCVISIILLQGFNLKLSIYFAIFLHFVIEFYKVIKLLYITKGQETLPLLQLIFEQQNTHPQALFIFHTFGQVFLLILPVSLFRQRHFRLYNRLNNGLPPV